MKADASDIIEGIIWIIVVLIWFISGIVKSFRKGRKKKEAGKKPTPAQRARQENQKDKEKPSPQETWTMLKGNFEDFFKEVARLREEKTPPPVPEPPRKTAPTNAWVEDEPPQAERSRRQETPVPGAYKEGQSDTAPALIRNLTGDELRRAVIYREILGPPVALRNDENPF